MCISAPKKKNKKNPYENTQETFKKDVDLLGFDKLFNWSFYFFYYNYEQISENWKMKI